MLSIIVAIAENYAIGRDNDLLWRLPNDLKRFKEITCSGANTLIMGRKTFQSLPKVLPGRKHIILTRNTDFNIADENVKVVHNVEELRSFIESQEEYFVIGGGEVYSLLLPYAQKMYITEVHKSFEAHAFFPHFDKNDWEVINRSDENVDENNGLRYTYVTYVRKK